MNKLLSSKVLALSMLTIVVGEQQAMNYQTTQFQNTQIPQMPQPIQPATNPPFSSYQTQPLNQQFQQALHFVGNSCLVTYAFQPTFVQRYSIQVPPIQNTQPQHTQPQFRQYQAYQRQRSTQSLPIPQKQPQNQRLQQTQENVTPHTTTHNNDDEFFFGNLPESYPSDYDPLEGIFRDF